MGFHQYLEYLALISLNTTVSGVQNTTLNIMDLLNPKFSQILTKGIIQNQFIEV